MCKLQVWNFKVLKSEVSLLKVGCKLILHTTGCKKENTIEM